MKRNDRMEVVSDMTVLCDLQEVENGSAVLIRSFRSLRSLQSRLPCDIPEYFPPTSCETRVPVL